MKLFLFILLLFTSCTYNLSAQRSKIIYFNKFWKIVDTEKDAEYYRIINFDSLNKPIGTVKDYFMNGKMQYEATKTYVDTNDITHDTIDGYARWYNSEGKMTREALYVKGKLDGEQKHWYDSGGLKMSSHFKNGIRDGEFIGYYENGKYYFKLNYVKGKLVDKKGTLYTTTSDQYNYFIDEFIPNNPYDWRLADSISAKSHFQENGLYIKNKSLAY